jgi:hypothetical protein
MIGEFVQYAKLDELKEGDKIELDAGFTCHTAGIVTVCRDENSGELYFACDQGRHYLVGQVDNDDRLIGIHGPL